MKRDERWNTVLQGLTEQDMTPAEFAEDRQEPTGKTGTYTTKAVTDLFVDCSLQVRNFDRTGVAMSDCCGKPAVTAVEFSDGRKMWRCKEHQGIRRLETGPVWDTVEVQAR